MFNEKLSSFMKNLFEIKNKVFQNKGKIFFFN